MLELAYRADSNSAAREGLWVRVPPAVPDSERPACVARRQDPRRCLDVDLAAEAYPYLLGLYLGDGSLSLGRRGVWRLRLTLDQRYPAIIARAMEAVVAVRGRPAGRVLRIGCIDVSSYWTHWTCAVPQHGPGPKHQRPMALHAWQRAAIERQPAEFLAGLIHSDGCRVINRVKGHEYPRYFFSNLSPAIREMFVWAASLVGVWCRQRNPRNIAVSRRESVAILDRLVGPKT